MRKAGTLEVSIGAGGLKSDDNLLNVETDSKECEDKWCTNVAVGENEERWKQECREWYANGWGVCQL